MAKIYVNFRTGTAVSGVWSYNDFGSITAIGVVSADLKDDSNVSTGVGLSIATNPFSAASGTGSNASAGAGEFTEEVLDYYNSFPISSPPDLVFTGLPANASVSFTAAGYQSGQASRDTTYTIGGNSATYDNDALASAPNPPVTVTGTTDGSGGLTVNLSGASSFARINGFILEYSASGLTIDSTDATMQRVTNFQVVGSNPA